MRHRLPLVVLILALSACRAPAADMVAEERPLGAAAQLGAARVLSIHHLRGGRDFGGLSGLSLDGDRVTAISDRGQVARFRMTTDHTGRPLAFADLEMAPLGGLGGGKEDSDAEEILRLPQGWLVSFERRHRLLSYGDALSDRPQVLDPPGGLAEQPENGGVEAMARLQDGRLLLLSEDGVDPQGRGLAWVGGPGGWHALSYVRSGPFQPTAAAQIPGGDLLVLERSFSLLTGSASRLVRVSEAQVRPGAEMRGQVVYTLAPPLLVDNYEGLAVRRRADGRAVAYVLSDDNFNPLQSTLMMAVELPEDF